MNETEFGPEYLDAYADRMATNSDELGARPFRQMAKAWNEDRKSIEALQTENSELQRQLANVRKAAA